MVSMPQNHDAIASIAIPEPRVSARASITCKPLATITNSRCTHPSNTSSGFFHRELEQIHSSTFAQIPKHATQQQKVPPYVPYPPPPTQYAIVPIFSHLLPNISQRHNASRN